MCVSRRRKKSNYYSLIRQEIEHGIFNLIYIIFTNTKPSVLFKKDKVFEISGKEITLGAGIGKGSYGEVYQAQWRGITVAGFSFINKFLISHFFFFS